MFRNLDITATAKYFYMTSLTTLGLVTHGKNSQWIDGETTHLRLTSQTFTSATMFPK